MIYMITQEIALCVCVCVCVGGGGFFMRVCHFCKEAALLTLGRLFKSTSCVMYRRVCIGVCVCVCVRDQILNILHQSERHFKKSIEVELCVCVRLI